MLLRTARQHQTEEQQMAVAPMLLQSDFMTSHSQACCSPWGYMRHSPTTWLTYSMHTHPLRRGARHNLDPCRQRWVHLSIRYIGVI